MAIVVSAAVIAYILFFKPDPNAGLAEGGFVAVPGQFDTFGTEAGGFSLGVSGDIIIMLNQLSNISLESEIGSNPAFSGLIDSSVDVEERDAGRENPFAPYEGKPIQSAN